MWTFIRKAVLWLAGLQLLVPVSLVSSTCSAAEGLRTGDLAVSEARAIEAVATSRPCAAITAFYLRKMWPEETSGEFYLQQCPTVALVASALEAGDRSAVELLAPTQPNPYSTVLCLVKIRWSVRTINKAASVLSTEARIVDRVGTPIEPAHIVEPPTSLLMTGGSFTLMGPSAAL
jgi:hypothetical protein